MAHIVQRTRSRHLTPGLLDPFIHPARLMQQVHSLKCVGDETEVLVPVFIIVNEQGRLQGNDRVILV